MGCHNVTYGEMQHQLCKIDEQIKRQFGVVSGVGEPKESR